MTLDLTIQEVDEIWMATEQQCPSVTSIDRLETICTVPSLLGSGYHREMELYPGLDLCIFNATYNDLTFRGVENRHLVQFMVHLSGIIDSGHFLYLDSSCETPSWCGRSLAATPVKAVFCYADRRTAPRTATFSARG